MAKKTLQAKNAKTQDAAVPAKPKRLSKAGEWAMAHPGGILKIVNMRAVMR